MKPLSFFLSTVVLLPISSSFAAPKIEFNSKVFNCGIVVEGKTEKINAVFTVRNTGDSVLKIKNVRPGCGCTVVKYDSLLLPGKLMNIESVVNIKGYRSGAISKWIMVNSNAENEQTVRLVIEALVQAPIELSTTFLNMDASQGGTPEKISLSTMANDLKITSIEFRSTEHNGGSPAWQSNLSIPLKYKLTESDSVRADGCRLYEL